MIFLKKFLGVSVFTLLAFVQISLFSQSSYSAVPLHNSHSPLKGSDSGTIGPEFTSFHDELRKLTTRYGARAQLIQYGRSQGGLPLMGIQIGGSRRRPSKLTPKAVVITAGVHGDEFLGIEDRLARWLVESAESDSDLRDFFEAGHRIYFFPVLNPDGYTKRYRVNANGVDLNRDFNLVNKNYFAFEEGETRSLVQWINTELKNHPAELALTLDYHCCIGALLHPKATRQLASDTAASRTHRVGTIFKSSFGKSYRFGTTPEVLGYDSLGTSKDYFTETFGALGFTFEGKKIIEKNQFDEHYPFKAE
ncbi:MAG: hypothetical protein EOP04_12835 [Proteobacteria bacterium]|nr:MAG: hypothetical protein EOP04_12835 [Pseudomonadota bacterium]